MSDNPSRPDLDFIPGDATASIPANFHPGAREYVAAGDVRLSADDQATVEALRPGTALLVALRGPNTGARFLLDDDEVSIGRHTEADIFLDDVTVSRRHAVFRRTDAGYDVTDVGSLNGTYVNGEIRESAPLHDGDEVQVGKFRLVYYGARTAS